MKRAVIFLMAAVLLAGIAPEAQAQKKQKFSAVDADKVFQKMQGSWQVKTLVWQARDKRFSEEKGTVNYTTDADKALSESFDIAMPDGTTAHYTGKLRYVTDKNRFELVGYNTTGKPALVMLGKWNPRFNMIAMHPVNGQKQEDGKKRLRTRLQYFFFDDGSFKKVSITPNGRGDYVIASEYHCKKQSIVGL